jgi:hypothetical protein
MSINRGNRGEGPDDEARTTRERENSVNSDGELFDRLLAEARHRAAAGCWKLKKIALAAIGLAFLTALATHATDSLLQFITQRLGK